MPMQPTRGDLHVDRVLTNVSIANIQSANAFIADKVFPIVPVEKQSDRYQVWLPEYWLRTQAALRAPASESVGGGFRIDNSPTYSCNKWSFHVDVADEQYANSDITDLDTQVTRFVDRQLLLRREIQFINTFLGTGIWQGFSSGGSVVDFQPNTHGQGYWDSATSNPAADVDMLRSASEQGTGEIPNTIVMTRNVYYALRNHPAVLDRIKYTQRGLVTPDLLASVFDVDRVLISAAVINTAQEGQTMTNTYMASNRIWVGYAAPAPGLMTPSAGYIFAWNGLFGAGAFGNRIKKYYIDTREAFRIEGDMAFDMKVVAPSMGVLGTNVLLHP